ncbi:TetR family transcriptional regulator [Streptomyces sp. NPDC004082]|uniref:TetR/AcrR family transcriptional regulator n=1 Tax=Streptomyces sp. NPDC005481 TaxID=3154881 RepID=UPI0033AEE3B1
MSYSAGGAHQNSRDDDIVPDPPRVAWRKETRRQVLAAAHQLASEAGWDNVSLAAVAERANVSRPSVYKAFGNRAGLGQALVLQETQQLLHGVAEQLGGPDAGLAASLERAMVFVLTEAERNPLVKAVVAAARHGSDSLLPYLTARPDPVFDAAQELLQAWFRVQYPHASAEQLELAADVTVRMTISHLILPAWEPTLAAQKLSRIVAAVIAELEISGN